MLPLEPGSWYYRVRGYNHAFLKRPQMAWSAPTALKVSKPTFSIVKGGRLGSPRGADDDLAFALSLADDADAISHGALRRRRPPRRDEARPDAGLRGRPRRRGRAARPARARAARRGRARRGGGRRDASGWIIDPIDGTRNYTRGIPVWATLIAYADRVAVVSAPALGRRWWAERGAGAFVNGEPIRRLGDRAGSRTRRVLYGSSGRRRRGRTTPGTSAASATSGRTCSSPRARPRPPSTRPASRSGTVAPLKVIVEEAGGRYASFPSRGTASSISASCVDRGLVDAVAPKTSRLRGEQLARGAHEAAQAAAPPRVQRDAFEAAMPPDASAARVSRDATRSQPASRSASAFGPVTESVFTPSTVRPEATPPARARETPTPGDVGDGDPVEETLELAGRRGGEPPPLRRVDDEPIADVDQLLEPPASPTAAARASGRRWAGR
jgi:hypothetical protein